MAITVLCYLLFVGVPIALTLWSFLGSGNNIDKGVAKLIAGILLAFPMLGLAGAIKGLHMETGVKILIGMVWVYVALWIIHHLIVEPLEDQN